MQARERSDLDSRGPVLRGVPSSYRVLSHRRGIMLVVTRRSRRAFLRPLLDQLRVSYTERVKGLAVSRSHPVMEEVERLDLDRAPRAALEGYAYAAKATAATYKGKPAVYADEAICHRLAGVITRLGHDCKRPAHHARGTLPSVAAGAGYTGTFIGAGATGSGFRCVRLAARRWLAH
ncbi:MAG: hypothetical protein U5L11_09110 [Arhodomonas sp.]|nr:hypothetical protein [Arhodomonas sp.]